MTEPDKSKKLFGALLSDRGLITELQLQSALEEQKKYGSRLGYWLVRLGYLPAETLADFLKNNKIAESISGSISEHRKAGGAIPRSLALYYKIAPVKIDGNVLTVAMSEVVQPRLVELLSEITGYRLDAMIQPAQEVRSLIDSAYPLLVAQGIEFSSLDHNSFIISDSRLDIKPLNTAQMRHVTDIGERLRALIAEAIKGKFREVLITPGPERSAICFRKDSLKRTDYDLRPAEQDDVSFLIFRLAKLDVLQQSTPQRGKFIVKINERKIVIVVNASPTIYGMNFVLEMFDEKVLKHSYEELLKSFPDVRKDVDEFFTKDRKGVLVITGPEGSGRVHFFYSLLSRVRETYNNIHTLECAIRYPLNGIRQNELSEEQMERVLEEYLYESPDLLAISVVRSARAAEVAFLLAARLPIVMILSSYDSFKAVEWLCRHRLKSPIKAGLLHAVISPRLIPRICSHCSVPYYSEEGSLAGLNVPPGTQLRMNQGCDHCRQKENLPSETFFESFRIDDEALAWISEDHSSSHLRSSARSAGRSTLFDRVVGDAFSDQLDMLSVAKLQSSL